MNIWLSALIVIGVTALVVVAMLVVRARGPEGGYFSDSDRAAGVFGMLGAGFAVLLAFVIFLAFEDYDDAKTAAGSEANAVTSQYETAEFFDARERDAIHGELICYARAVIALEWPAMDEGKSSAVVDGWVYRIWASFDDVDISGAGAETGYSKWFDETTLRDESRRKRLLEATGPVPAPLWIVLILYGVLLVVYMLFWADRGERRFVQAMWVGAVAVMIVSSLLVVNFLTHPYSDGTGRIEPEAMADTLKNMDKLERALHPTAPPPPCNAQGRPNARAIPSPIGA